ncbi:MAG: hypothetical protein JXD21_00585 [Candidatus Omnitrophica bacterium]|nr:hypothetical protein [Candidatus Omnitrophota bacterium]
MFHFLLISAIVSVIVLIFHSSSTKGARITFHFFLFMLLWGFRRESTLPFSPVAPYRFTVEGVSTVLVICAVILGWIFTFYMSWYLSELILGRTRVFRERLFSTLFLSLFIAGTISYAFEATGISAGWWVWQAVSSEFSSFFVAGYNYGAVIGWIEFYIFFMLPFFLIESSSFKDNVWKSLFFLIPASYMWIYFSREFALIRFIVFDGVIVLAFFSHLKLVYRPSRTKESANSFLKMAPSFLAVGTVMVFTAVDLCVVREPQLIFSKLPFIFIILLTIGRIPVVIPLALAGLLAGFFGKPAVPGLVVVLFVSLLYALDWLYIRSSLSRDRSGPIRFNLFPPKAGYIIGALCMIAASFYLLSPRPKSVGLSFFHEDIPKNQGRETTISFYCLVPRD